MAGLDMADAGGDKAPAAAAEAAPATTKIDPIMTKEGAQQMELLELDGKPLKLKKGQRLIKKRRQRTGKAGLLSIAFKMGTFLVLYGGLRIYRWFDPPLDTSNRQSEIHRSFVTVERADDILGVPFGDVERRAGLEEDGTDAEGNVVPSNGAVLRQVLKKDWSTVMKAKGATHRAIARLLKCVWKQADPCGNPDGKMRKSKVNFAQWGCDWKGSQDLMIACKKGKVKEDLLFPGNSSMAHQYEWNMIANGASACIAGTENTGTVRYINLFGFYGDRNMYRCGRSDPAALLMVLGVTPSNETKIEMALEDLPPDLVKQIKKQNPEL